MNIFDKNTSLRGLSTVNPVEFPIPLWFSNGTYVAYNSATTAYLQDGSASATTGATNSNVRLHKLASWASNMQFAFEATIYTNNVSYASYAQLWDFTAGAAVVGTALSTASNSLITLRSGRVSLIPGHEYGVAVWNPNGYYANITDASLIVFP